MKGLATPVNRQSIGDPSAVHRLMFAPFSRHESIVAYRLERSIMDVIGYLASALAGLPAILGIARGYGAALAVAAQALTHWPGAIVMAVAVFAFVSSEAHGQTEAAAVVSAVRTDPQAREGESRQPGQAIYSPFFSGAIAQEQCTFVASKASSAPEPDLTMTLAASTAGVVALVWLLQRI